MAKNSEATLLLRIKAIGQEALSRTGDALKAIGTLAIAASAAIVGAATAAIHAYHEQEAATNSLNRALITQGIYSKDLSKSYHQMATELQRSTTYGDESIVNAQAQMQAYLGQTQITKDLMKATLDFAAAKKIDLATAADVVGKSIGGTTNMLGRYGVQVDANASKSERMAQALSGLNAHFKGQSEAAASGLGALTQMKNSLGDILEAVGERLAPVIVAGAVAIRNFADDISSNTKMLDGFVSVLHTTVQAGAILKGVFVGVGEVLGQVLGTTFGAIAQAMDGNFAMAFESIKSGMKDTADLVVSNADRIKNDIAIVDQSFLDAKQENHEKEIAMINENNAQKKLIEEEHEAMRQEDFLVNNAEFNALTLEQQKTFRDQYLADLQNQRMTEKQSQLEAARLSAVEQIKSNNQYLLEQQKFGTAYAAINKAMRTSEYQGAKQAFGELGALTQSENAKLKAIGKAAAMVNIAIRTAESAMNIYAGFSAIPIVGIGLGVAGAAAAVAFGAEQMGKVSALADGGIVRARPGGIQAVIGEGGKDEAVIPLDDDRASGVMGNKINIVVYGGMLGDANSAREFAIAMDQELLKLRRSNQSVAFDSGVT